MNKRRRLLFALAACLILSVACVLFFQPGQPNEPEYQGKRAGEWLKLMINGGYFEANQAFRSMGQQVVPFLISVLEGDETTIMALYRKLYYKLSSVIPDKLKQKLPGPWERDNRKLSAAFALNAVGTNATEAIPFILNALNEPATVLRLNHVGYLPCNLMEALGTIALNSPFEHEIVEALIPYTRDSESLTRRMAYLQLGKFSGLAERSVPVLVQGLDDKDEDVRDSVVNALGLLGPKAISASSNLLHYIRAGRNRFGALEALKDINPEAAAEVGIE